MERERLLERSALFEERLDAALPAGLRDALPIDPRHRATLVATRLALEHGAAARILLLTGVAPQSGAALVRLQYEALLRAAWSLYAATPAHVSRLTATLDAQGEKSAEALPSAKEMLEALVKAAPAGIHVPLTAFREATWKALNSFVHTGLHAVSRAAGGFPEALAVQLVRCSNALMHQAYRQLGAFSGQSTMDTITALHRDYSDCLPVMAPLTAATPV